MGRDGFILFQRLIGLTTTHFGMSTPIINEERQNRANEILGRSLHLAEDAQRRAAVACCGQGEGALYDLELVPTPAARGARPAPSRAPVRLPVVLPVGTETVRVEDGSGNLLAASLTDVELLPDGRRGGYVRFAADFREAESLRIRINPSSPSPARSVQQLQNEWIRIEFSEAHGVEELDFQGRQIGKPGFLDPFVTYGKETWRSAGYELLPLELETWNGLQRVRLRTSIPMQAESGEYASDLTYTFTLFDDLPYLLVDVEAAFAYTPPRQVIHNMTQKLRRLMDLHWEEAAPMQLTPALSAPGTQPLRVWKHNYLGITSYYDLNYGQFNAKTAAWMRSITRLLPAGSRFPTAGTVC